MHYLPIAVMAPLALTACWFDIVQRRLPNWLVLLTMIAGLGLGVIGPGPAELPSRLGHVGIALLAGMALYRIGMVGAGDAKFYAAAAAWFRLGQAFDLLLATSLIGFAMAVGWIVRRRLAPLPQVPIHHPDRHKLPFGVAIAGGAFAALLLSY